MNNFQQHPTPRGYVLPVVMLAMSAMLLLMVGMLTMVGLERDTASAWKNRYQAELAAESALSESKLLIAQAADNDSFQIIRTDAIPAGASEPTPYYFAVKPADTSGVLSYQYLPLFSTDSVASTNNLLESPEDLGLPTDADDYVREQVLPWQKAKTMAWKYIKNEAGENIARYAWWAEDMQAYLDPRIAGNKEGAQSLHLRNDHTQAAPGINEDIDHHALNRIALYTLNNNAPDKDAAGGVDDKLIDHRGALLSTGSILAAADAPIQLTRDADGHLTDDVLRRIEENLAIGNKPYFEQPTIPFNSGVAAAQRGKPRLNLNELLGDNRDNAVSKIATHIHKAYPYFSSTRQGGFPDNYLQTLAANMLDYADEDLSSTQKDDQYRGLEAAPMVSEHLMRFRWESILTENGRKYVELSCALYVELWNPTNLPVYGNFEANYSVNYSFPLGAVPSVDLGEPSMIDDPDTTHNLVKKYNDYYFPVLSLVKGQSNGSKTDELKPNEYRVVKMGTVRYKIDAGPSSTWIPSPINLANDDGKSNYRVYWNGKLYDWSRTLLDRNAATLNYPSDTSSKPRGKVRCTVPGHSYGQYGAFVNNMGDPRMCFYIGAVQGANSYPRNYSPGRRNIRLGIYRGGNDKIYGRVQPSEWPDGGHDSPFGSEAFYTTDQRLAPDDNRFMSGIPAPDQLMAPQKISNRGRFYSVTELGHIYDPVMWYTGSGDRNPGLWLDIEKNAASSPNYGGGNTLRIGRKEHPKFDEPGSRAANLIDLFHVGDPREESAADRHGKVVKIDGQVNINTASEETLRTLIAGFLKTDPKLSEVTGSRHDASTNAPPVKSLELSAPTIKNQADMIAQAIIDSRPFVSLGDVAATEDSHGRRVFGNKELYAQSDGIQWNDAAAEELYARLVNSSTVRSRNFRVHVVAQALNKKGNSTSTIRKTYQIFANPGERTPDGELDPTKLRIETTYENDR